MDAVLEVDGRQGGWQEPAPAQKDPSERTPLDPATFRHRFCLHIYRNLLVVSVALLMVFTADSAIITIESSLNPEGGLGTASLSVRMATAALQALFLNAVILPRLNLKRSMLVGIILYAAYIAGNVYPQWYTLVPTAALAGVGYALLRTAESTYVARLASIYADQMDLPPDTTKSRFFAIYYVFYCSARVLGNVASSLILGSGIERYTIPNMTEADAISISGCGPSYCPAAVPLGNTSDVKSSPAKGNSIYYLYAFCFGCDLLAFVLMLVTLDNLESLSVKRYGVHVPIPKDNRSMPHGWRDLLATIKTWRNPKQLLLLPLCFYNGIDNAFWQADFTKSFVTCAYGIQWVGFVVAWYGLTAPVIVFILALASKVVCRPIPFLVAVTAHIGTGIALLYWTPTGLAILFVLSSIWGIGSGLWPVCLIAYHGILFEDNLEGAFSTYWLCDSLGATLTYAWSYSLCTSTKINIVIALVSVGFLGYLLTEMITFVEKVRHSHHFDSVHPVTT